jgi:hypothetical protein
MAEIKSYPNNADVFIGAEYPMKWHHGRTSGVFGAEGNAAVAAVDGQMAVTVSDGVGWLADANGDGIVWWSDAEAQTAQKLALQLDTADGVLNRIDRVIVEWSTPNYTQLPEIRVLKGVNAVSPAAPALTNNASTRQISLARISVAAGTLAVTAGMITDERLDETVCGIVNDHIAIDTSMAAAQFEEILSAARGLVDALTAEAVPNHASTHASGGDDPVSPGSILAAGKSALLEFTLDADNWSDNGYTITSADLPGLSAADASTAVEVLPGLPITEDQLEALQAANLQDGGQAAGSITLKAFGDVPEMDIPIRLIVRGDLY